jgi:hypothetical protein
VVAAVEIKAVHQLVTRRELDNVGDALTLCPSMPNRALFSVPVDTTVVAVPGCCGTGIELLLILPF